jgi:DNA-binding beta-propeller fold protein YncE
MLRSFQCVLVAAIASTILLGTAQCVYAQKDSARLKVLDTVRVGTAKNWDYPVVDSESHRLYIACGDHVLVVDTRRGTRIGDIVGVKGAHGIAIVPGKNLGFITSGKENAVAVFDPQTLKVTRKISMPNESGENPDPIVYDPASRKVFALCEGGDAVVIDPAKLGSPPTAIHCGGALEYGRSDGAGRLFINNEDKSEIDVVDTETMKLTDRWSLAPLETPSGLAIDLKHHRLFSVGENQKMAVIDYDRGKLVATVPIGAGSDGCAFDSALGVALSSNGDDGTVTIVGETSPGKFAVVQTLDTLKSGRTITDDPATNRFYIPAAIPSKAGQPAQFGFLIIGAAK